MRTLLVSLVLLGARVAAADQVLATPLLGVPAPGGQKAIICSVLNVSTRDVVVNVELLSLGGNIVGGSDQPGGLPSGTPLAPNFAATYGSPGTGDFCRFIITQGSKRDVRLMATIYVYLDNGDKFSFALPAQ